MFSNLEGARVLLTGNTGFKGSWMSCLLEQLGIEIIGLSLPNEKNRLYKNLKLDQRIKTHFGDICDKDFVSRVCKIENPDVIVHFAAQPLVIDSYSDPTGTFLTNVIGTSNILEIGNSISNNKASLIITTDKVYRNNEEASAFEEEDQLGGADPYSASKACAELVTQVWNSPNLNPFNIKIASARAGNVIGGGDESRNRLIPDLVESFSTGSPAKIRNSKSVRPWQYVLDPLYGYLILLNRMVSKTNLHHAYNFGPSPSNFLTVGDLADLVSKSWDDSAIWEDVDGGSNVLESKFLTIDSHRAKTELGWECKVNIDTAVEWIVEWEKSSNKLSTTRSQIDRYLEYIK